MEPRTTRMQFVLVALAAAAILVAGVAGLMRVRIARGDVYPAWSSLRADPLGTRVLFESLSEALGCPVRRSFAPLADIDGADTCVHIAVGMFPLILSYAPADQADAIDSIVRAGGDLVIGLEPHVGLFSAAQVWAQDSTDEDSAADSTAGASDEDAPRRIVSLLERWGVEPVVSCVSVHADSQVYAQADSAFAEEHQGLSHYMPWDGRLGLRLVDTAWHAAYRVESCCVVAWRAVGAGRIVLLADSYLLSNQALAFEREAGLLSWLVGSPCAVVFHETHLGVAHRRGIAWLVGKHGLWGVVAGVALVFLLGVWRTAVPFAPSMHDEDEKRRSASSTDATGQLAQQFERLLARERVLRTCTEEWRRAAPLDRTVPAELPDDVDALRVARQHQVQGGMVETYNEIVRLVQLRTARPTRRTGTTSTKGTTQ